MPTIYPDAEFIPPSVLPTPKTSRKPPSRVRLKQVCGSGSG